MIKDSDWYYCELCDTPCIMCKFCRNTSCNGGGCEKCVSLWKEVNKKLEIGDHPPKRKMKIIEKPNFEELL